MWLEMLRVSRMAATRELEDHVDSDELKIERHVELELLRQPATGQVNLRYEDYSWATWDYAVRVLAAEDDFLKYEESLGDELALAELDQALLGLDLRVASTVLCVVSCRLRADEQL
jgi:hypothetical protein